MTEAAPGASGGRPIKQESEAFGFFDSLDILATIATQELKSKSEEKVGQLMKSNSNFGTFVIPFVHELDN